MIFPLFASLLLAQPPAQIAAAIAAEHLAPDAVSFIVVDLETGRPVISQNAELPRSPASTLKAVTTFASLDLLGPAYTWHTHALARGPIEHGVLDGDLVLQGGGDPYLTLERWWSFAHRLRGLGLQSIHGDIVIDNSAFSPPAEDAGAFDGRPNRVYNAVPDALMVNFQSIQFRVASNADERRIDILADPNPSNLIIDNRIRYAPGRCSGAASRVAFEIAAPDADRVTFTGRLAAHCSPRELTRVVLTPAEYAYGTFVSLWREQGGSVEGKLRLDAAPPDARPLLDFESLSLGEIVRLTNKYSSNLMARHLLLTLGAERFGAPATVAKGSAAISAWAQMRAIDLGDFAIDNGSGLSRTAHISAAAMANVLRAAYVSSVAPEFIASLPLAGLDGTLRSRMSGGPLGSVRLKTGHIDGVSGVAGYVKGASGKTYVLVCLINDTRVDTGAGEALHAALVKWILETL